MILATMVGEGAELVLETGEVIQVRWVGKGEWKKLAYFLDYEETVRQYFA